MDSTHRNYITAVKTYNGQQGNGGSKGQDQLYNIKLPSLHKRTKERLPTSKHEMFLSRYTQHLPPYTKRALCFLYMAFLYFLPVLYKTYLAVFFKLATSCKSTYKY